jgi:hypothetical protein
LPLFAFFAPPAGGRELARVSRPSKHHPVPAAFGAKPASTQVCEPDCDQSPRRVQTVSRSRHGESICVVASNEKYASWHAACSLSHTGLHTGTSGATPLSGWQTLHCAVSHADTHSSEPFALRES